MNFAIGALFVTCANVLMARSAFQRAVDGLFEKLGASAIHAFGKSIAVACDASVWLRRQGAGIRGENWQKDQPSEGTEKSSWERILPCD
ncbi:MAG: hypothetical protein HY287_00820 [Planctomycetes bacterium]|nr:hypothetical protein [Planctomycetota bacterium]